MSQQPAHNISIERAEQLIGDADALRRSGRSIEWIRQQWIDSGISPGTADVLVRVLTNDLPKARRRARVKLGLSMIAAPVLLIGLIFGIIAIVNASKGPNAYGMASDAVNEACGSRVGGTSAIEVGDEVMLVGGSGLTGEWITRSSHDDFASIVLDGDDLRTARVLCSSVSQGTITRCEGYYSQEVIDALEANPTLEDAMADLLSHPDSTALRYELLNGGMSVSVSSARLKVDLVDLSSGATQDSTEINLPAECPTTHYSNGWSTRTERTSPTADDTVTAVFALTGVEL